MRLTRLIVAVAAVALLNACAADHITVPKANERTSSLVSDANHNGGNPRFFFLPPTVAPSPGAVGGSTGAFDASLQPTVTICALDLPATARESDVQQATPCKPGGYSRTIPFGTSGNVVRLHAPRNRRHGDGDDDEDDDDDDRRASGHYHAKWPVPVSADAFYRVRVTVAGYDLGFADLHSVSSGKDLKKVGTDNFIARKDGQTLQVKFRVLQGIFPLMIAKVSGDEQEGAAGATLANPLVVRVTDASGYPAEGVQLSFVPGSGSGSTTPQGGVTASDGSASSSWTLGTSAGSQVVTVSLSDATANSVSFTAMALAGWYGEWRGVLSGAAFSIQIWNAGGQMVAAAEFTGRARESLRVLGEADGPPRTLYFYRAQDNALIGFVRDAAGRVTIEYWESGCARSVTPVFVSATVPSTDPGAVYTDVIAPDFLGTWSGTISGSSFTVSVNASGGVTTAQGNFGLGSEQFIVLGFASGPPRALNLFRPQDKAGMTLFNNSAGQPTLEYWENSCARSSPLVQQ